MSLFERRNEMNGNGGRYGTETVESILGELEGLEWDETDESEERSGRGRRFGRRPPPPTAPGTGLVTPRPNTQFVTQTQLQTALAKVGSQIKTNSDAIKTVSDRVSSQADLLSKEVVARKKKTDELEKGLRQTRELTAILPLLSRPKSVQLQSSAVVGSPSPAPKALVDSDDTLSFILPLMLLGGSGGSGGGGMFGGGGDDNSMMMLVLALSLGKK
jgi:hypothetical protein